MDTRDREGHLIRRVLTSFRSKTSLTLPQGLEQPRQRLDQCQCERRGAADKHMWYNAPPVPSFARRIEDEPDQGFQAVSTIH